MEEIPPGAKNAFSLEPGETLLAGWKAIQMRGPPAPTFRQEFNRNTTDLLLFTMSGFLFLTNERILFVCRRRTDFRYELIPALSRRLTQLTTVEGRARSLLLGYACFRVLGADIEHVARMVERAKAGDIPLAAAPFREPTFHTPLPRRTPRPTSPPLPSSGNPRIRMVRCQGCGVLNPGDLMFCGKCGKSL